MSHPYPQPTGSAQPRRQPQERLLNGQVAELADPTNPEAVRGSERASQGQHHAEHEGRRGMGISSKAA